jgi:hypothetical protein
MVSSILTRCSTAGAGGWSATGLEYRRSFGMGVRFLRPRPSVWRARGCGSRPVWKAGTPQGWPFDSAVLRRQAARRSALASTTVLARTSRLSQSKAPIPRSNEPSAGTRGFLNREVVQRGWQNRISGSAPPVCASVGTSYVNKSRTVWRSVVAVKGFCRNATPVSSTPWWTIAFSA